MLKEGREKETPVLKKEGKVFCKTVNVKNTCIKY